MTALGESSNSGVVRVRQAGPIRKDGLKGTGILSIPAAMMRMIPEGSRFRAEWHEDGILYRFLGTSDEPADTPKWVEDS